jgi:glycyl-tRNA synthetase
MTTKARALYEELRRRFLVDYDDSGAIGRRYRRQDEIGTPWALTIDDQTLEDDTVTVRDRDSLAQVRIAISQAGSYLAEALAADWKTPKPE